MKLRNKKTGKIIDAVMTGENEIEFQERGSFDRYTYKSLAELNEEWEDYEEPKDFWFIDPEVLIACESTEPLLCDKKVAVETMKQIGNYFETKEEAEKAVEKLKAWKRLKDKGFRFIDHTDYDDGNITIWGKFNKELDVRDVDLLFGGEE